MSNASRTECPECRNDLGESIKVPAGETCPGCGTFTAPDDPSGAGGGVPQGSPAPPPALPAEAVKPKKVQFTGKVRRGLALMRMVQMASMSDDCPSIPTFIERWSKAQQSDYNAALAWMEQEEDWDSVADAWDRGRFGGKRGGK